jgi:hypothetical protein
MEGLLCFPSLEGRKKEVVTNPDNDFDARWNVASNAAATVKPPDRGRSSQATKACIGNGFFG